MNGLRKTLAIALLAASTLAGCSPEPVADGTHALLARDINALFVELRLATSNLAGEASAFFGHMDGFDSGLYPPDRYAFYENSVYYTPEDDGGCVVWASGKVPVDEAVRLKITRMEHLCPAVQDTAESSPYISQSYVLGPEHFFVCHPFFDSVALMPPGLDMTTSIMPYYLADPAHNPEREPVWVEPYIDATGKGYIITVSCPVYSEDGFEGVAGSDIAILPISNNFLEPRPEPLFLVSSSTLLLAINEAGQQLLSLEPLGEYYYLEGVQQDEYVSDASRLSQHDSPDIQALAQRLAEGGESFDLVVNGTNIRFFTHAIPEVGWRLVHAEEL